MFAYVRLCSLNRKKNVESAARLDYAEWGKTGRIQMSHGETFDIPLHRNRLRKSSSQDPSFVRQPIERGLRGRFHPLHPSQSYGGWRVEGNEGCLKKAGAEALPRLTYVIAGGSG